MEQSRRNFLKQGSLYIPAAAAAGLLMTTPKLARADSWGSLRNVGSIWDPCSCSCANCTAPAVNLDMVGGDGSGYWGQAYSMMQSAYNTWNNLPGILNDGYTLPNALITDPSWLDRSQWPGVDTYINDAAASCGLNINPEWGAGGAWLMCIYAQGTVSANQPLPTFSDSWNKMLNHAYGRSQGYQPDALFRNPWLAAGGIALIFSGVGALLIPIPGFNASVAFGVIGIGLAFVKLAED